ncbi:MAG: hypothetical protein JNN08_08325 [Bryobacterales bacterium]|nr:hypothetical protein [Bryobacterales bacterium]
MEAATLTYMLMALPVIKLARALPVGRLEDAQDRNKSLEAQASATADEHPEH